MSTSQAVIKIFSLATIAFVMAMALTPLFTNFVYKYKFGKKIRAEGDTPIYSKLHEHLFNFLNLNPVLLH